MVVATYNIDDTNYDVVKYMEANSIMAEDFGFSVERGWYESTVSGVGLGVARWSGHGDLYGKFEITPDKLNIFNLKLENMRVTFGLSADGNASSGGFVNVYYSEEDYDAYAVNPVISTGIGQYFYNSVDITFRKEPIQKISFLIGGSDGESAGAYGFISSIILNPKGRRTYLLQNGKPVNSELYGQWEVDTKDGGSFTWEEDGLKYSSGEVAVAGDWIKTSSMVDFTGYKTLHAQVYLGNYKLSSSALYLDILGKDFNSNVLLYGVNYPNFGMTLVIDLSYLEEKQLPIGIAVSGYEEAIIYDIWLE